MQQLSLKWPIIITASVAVVEVIVCNDITTFMRPIATLWFVAFCPGMAFVHLLRLRDAFSEAVLAVALSLVLALLVAATMLYLGLWSPKVILMILITLSMAGVCAQLFLWFRERTHANVEQARQMQQVSTRSSSTGTLA
jgi:hypothetical protein